LPKFHRGISIFLTGQGLQEAGNRFPFAHRSERSIRSTMSVLWNLIF